MAQSGSWTKPDVIPRAPWARIGHQVANTTMDVALLNRMVDSKSNDPFYPGAPRAGIPGATPTRKAIEDHKMLKQFTVQDGAFSFMLRGGVSNRRHKKSDGKPSDVCIPVFSSLIGLRRRHKADGEVRFTDDLQDYEALEWEHEMTLLGIALPPAADQDNHGNFVTVQAGNTAVKVTGKGPIKLGQGVAWRVPRPYEYNLGYIKDETNPVAWMVPVDPATWDLNQRERFIRVALHHFGASDNPLDKKTKKIRLGTGIVEAMFADDIVVGFAGRRRIMRDIIKEHIRGLEEFDVAVVQLVLHGFLAHAEPALSGGATPAASRDYIYSKTRDRPVLKQLFENLALDLIPSVRSAVDATDHTKFGKALESGKQGSTIFVRVGYM